MRQRRHALSGTSSDVGDDGHLDATASDGPAIKPRRLHTLLDERIAR